jgi:uncharacterized membrane protein YeaQ/YmgE (transglycosylase-associated protein family)
MSMGILSWIVLGGLAGWVASMFAGNNARQGIIGNIIVGIIGAFVGGFVFSLFDKAGVTGFNFYSFAVACVGAVITLFLKKMLTGRA